MDAYSPSQLQPFLRSCLQESDQPIEGEQKGEIPKWLKGCLIRSGSGLLVVGPDKYNHLFDGMALLHRFAFSDGKVTYQNRFLRSDAYKKNMKHNRIVQTEFGTKGIPDPCKTIFQRFASMFSHDEPTDNDMVNIIMYGKEPYSCTESCAIWKINPDTLDAVEKVKLNEHLPVNAAVAHAHEEPDGTVYNVGSFYSRHSSYCILKFPPKDENVKNTFENSSVVCKIPASEPWKISYHHSFGMSDNYFIFVEQPMHISVSKLAWSRFSAATFAESMSWDDNAQTRFHVVRRSDGKLLDTVFVSKGFFTFHHINAYEEDNQLIVDISAYKDGAVIKCGYIKALEEMYLKNKNAIPLKAEAHRYVLPLSIPEGEKEEGKNLVTLPNCSATARYQADGKILLTHEILTGSDPWFHELPRINYKRNGKKYRYFYAMAKQETLADTNLIKVDTEKKETISWSEEGALPSEPVFLEEPGATDEDSGVLLASLLYRDDEKKVSMIVINAKTMQEIGRVNFMTQASVPGDFHGVFIPKD
ncbi:carotenoid-cleaving dioxygenase, mitochondrial-like [Uloborus diversus]|uniref:carotenoid-cleaving dioxygenase, mitochondrial-like n=1 Tax=Uloborus diversus TaxID=327109 RepID=UPI002409228C|nr:carotenoid-cleaving dioxygenase, mitochondrial-like [Uloborus diversus]